MASSNVDDWDAPLPSTDTLVDDGEEEETPEDVKREAEQMEMLKCYVNRMAYKPTKPPTARPRTEELAQPKKLALVDNYALHHGHLTPKQRRQRFKRTVSKYNVISTEQLEQIVKDQKAKERQKENLIKRKQTLYYEMLTKLERQCREQYLNVILNKFADYLAKLATTMPIPPQLSETYSRMQRGIFCNILLAIGVQPTNQAAIHYNTPEAQEFDVCHKLAHALLSLIIKALDTAARYDLEQCPIGESEDIDLDNYIKQRLMCAAEKKLLNKRSQNEANILSNLSSLFKKCENFPVKNC